jgi:DNA polymerase III psi subunit
MSFLNPIWLWGLTALSVPIAIHLLSRKEGKVIPMGSLRYLKDANTQQFKSLRLNEILLLILRCLLITLVLLFLAGLQINTAQNRKWLVVEPGLEKNKQATIAIDTLIEQGYEFHYLADQFPDRNHRPDSTSINYWYLTEDLTRRGISDIVVLATGRIESFKGFRIARPSNLKWITIQEEYKEYLVSAVKNSKDSLLVKKGLLDNDNTQYTTTIISSSQKVVRSGADSIKVTLPDTVSILVASDTEFNYDALIIEASLRAIQKNTSVILVIKKIDADHLNKEIKANWLVWLSKKSIATSQIKNRIIYQHKDIAPVFQHEYDTLWLLTKRLTQKVALEENISLKLNPILFPLTALQQVADSKDQRVMPEEMMWSENNLNNDEIIKASVEPMDNYLISLIILVLLIERWIAYRRNQ